MLKQASVAQIRNQDITRADGYIVIAMCIYPRGLKRELRDEFLPQLAPSRELLADFKNFEKSGSHDEAFIKCDYYTRFRLSESGSHDLRHVSDLSRTRDVILVCQCQLGQRCHREMLMLMARERFSVEIGEIYHEYPLA